MTADYIIFYRYVYQSGIPKLAILKIFSQYGLCLMVGNILDRALLICHLSKIIRSTNWFLFTINYITNHSKKTNHIRNHVWNFWRGSVGETYSFHSHGEEKSNSHSHICSLKASTKCWSVPYAKKKIDLQLSFKLYDIDYGSDMNTVCIDLYIRIRQHSYSSSNLHTLNGSSRLLDHP